MAENQGENLLIEEDEDQESKSKSQEVEFVPVDIGRCSISFEPHHPTFWGATLGICTGQ